MWIYNNDFNKWYSTDDKLSLDNFNYLKQELSSTRFYSKCLSGATYLPINNTNNIYDILGEYEPRNWYVGILGSSYSNSLIPSQHAMPITSQTSYDYYTKYLGEYGLTLKNHFTPNRIIKESVKNYIEVIYNKIEFLINESIDNDSKNLVEAEAKLLSSEPIKLKTKGLAKVLRGPVFLIRILILAESPCTMELIGVKSSTIRSGRLVFDTETG
jgi:hypothetical protein